VASHPMAVYWTDAGNCKGGYPQCLCGYPSSRPVLACGPFATSTSPYYHLKDYATQVGGTAVPTGCDCDCLP
jgi:hypothetical protein